MKETANMQRNVSPAILGRLTGQRAGQPPLEVLVAPRDASKVVREHLDLPKSDVARRIERGFRVPTSESVWPGIYWIACVALPTTTFHQYVVPTDAEIWQIRSYIEYVATRAYNDNWRKKILDDALPVCAGHNTVIFCKYPDTPLEGFVSQARGWGYRRMSWETASWPHGYQSTKAKNLPDHPLTLTEVIDHCEGFSDRPNPKWEAWKAEHPTVFPAQKTEAL